MDAFTEKNLIKAGYETNPLKDGSLTGHLIVEAPITTLTREAVKELHIDNKSAQKTKNMFALGMVFYMFNRGYKKTFKFFETKFKANPLVVNANKLVLTAGYNFAHTIEAFANTFKIEPAPLDAGLYRNVTGNLATAWGFLAAAERSGRNLFRAYFQRLRPLQLAKLCGNQCARFGSL